MVKDLIARLDCYHLVSEPGRAMMPWRERSGALLTVTGARSAGNTFMLRNWILDLAEGALTLADISFYGRLKDSLHPRAIRALADDAEARTSLEKLSRGGREGGDQS